MTALEIFALAYGTVGLPYALNFTKYHKVVIHLFKDMIRIDVGNFFVMSFVIMIFLSFISATLGV